MFLKSNILIFMRKLAFIQLFLLGFANTAIAAPGAEVIEYWDARDEKSTVNIDHSVWQSLLNQYLDDQHASGINRFDYKAVTQADIERLDGYLSYLQAVRPRMLNADEQMAYWINLYNAKTVELVTKGVQQDNISSIRDIKAGFFSFGPWKQKVLKVEGRELSLDNVEHGILRPIWQDHRIHFAVNCASIGCPNLLKTAFTAENTESLLEKGEEDYLTHPRGAQILDDELVVSSLFDWYGGDFASSTSEFLEYLGDFAADDIVEFMATNPDIDFEYDWGLNTAD